MTQSVSILTHGHRGARGLFPENTLPAFQYALESKIDVLEMDLGVTSDGILVVTHDPFISANVCLNPDGTRIEVEPLVNSLTLDKVQAFDSGSLENPVFTRQRKMKTRIPTLEEVFALIRNFSESHAQDVQFNIETKIFPRFPEYTVSPEIFSHLVVQAFQKSGFLERIMLQSFDPRTLIFSKAKEPALRTVMLLDDPTAVDFRKLKQEIQCEAISPNFALLNVEIVSKIHQSNMAVIPWTANQPEQWESLIQMGVGEQHNQRCLDGIISDYPLELKTFLDHRQKSHR